MIFNMVCMVFNKPKFAGVTSPRRPYRNSTCLDSFIIYKIATCYTENVNIDSTVLCYCDRLDFPLYIFPYVVQFGCSKKKINSLHIRHCTPTGDKISMENRLYH